MNESAVDEFNFDDSSDVDHTTLSRDGIHRRLVWWWFCYFRKNANYKIYCDAMKRSDSITCIGLEKKFKNISRLFKDWGNIHELPNSLNEKSPQWQSWLSDHNDLFFGVDRTIKTLTPPFANISDDRIVLSIPKGLSKMEIKSLLADYARHTYPGADSFSDPQQPKYPISKDIGLSTLQAVDRADFVYDLHVEEGYSYAEIAKLVSELKILSTMDFGWAPATKEEEFNVQNATTGNNKLSSYSNERRTAINLKKYRNDCVAGTIDGIFPAKY
jgi:hypothetical protein